MKLDALLAHPFQLPSVPKVVALLLTELDHPEPDLQHINQLIGTDVALTARLLQLANSDFFKLQGTISSVSEALALLKLSHVRAMAQSAASAASFKSVPGIDLQKFWKYSLNVARVSRAVAGLVRQNQQAAFTCGLVHAMGELAMHLAMPDEMAQLDNLVSLFDMRRAKAERHRLGYCYATVSAAYARQWHFPPAMVDALEHQYAPFKKDAGSSAYEPMAGVIHLATWRARGRELRMNERELAGSFPSEVAVFLGLDIDMVLQQDPFDWGVPA